MKRGPAAGRPVWAALFVLAGCARAEPEVRTGPGATVNPRTSASGPTSAPRASAPSIRSGDDPPGSIAAATAPPPGELNVLLLSVDALRADMPWNGYARPIAPTLSRLAERSVVYTHAYALSCYTSMSLAGLMTGRYPSELHRDGRTTSTFYSDETFLAELLAPRGIRAVGAFGHVWFAGATGIQQGFDQWQVVPHTITSEQSRGFVTDDVITDLLIASLDAHAKTAGEKRFFAWAHYMDPHFSYVSHAGTPSFRARDLGPSETPLGPGLKLSGYVQARRDRYDGEVAFTDAQIARLLAHVDQSDWGKRTAVVVTADHGEAFGEHGNYAEHGFYLYDVVTRVPLLFKLPGVAPARIDTRRSHIDLARTLLELLGVGAPDSFRGVSLLPEIRGERPPQRDLVIDLPYSDQMPRRRALIRGRHKIIVSESEPRPLLFDLDADPGEQHDLAADQPALLAELRAAYDRVNASLPDSPAPRRSKREY